MKSFSSRACVIMVDRQSAPRHPDRRPPAYQPNAPNSGAGIRAAAGTAIRWSSTSPDSTASTGSTASATSTAKTRRMVERLRMVDANTIDYELTVEDPTIYTRPWKMNYPMRRAGTGGTDNTTGKYAWRNTVDRGSRPVRTRGVGEHVQRRRRSHHRRAAQARLQVVQGRHAPQVGRILWNLGRVLWTRQASATSAGPLDPA